MPIYWVGEKMMKEGLGGRHVRDNNNEYNTHANTDINTNTTTTTATTTTTTNNNNNTNTNTHNDNHHNNKVGNIDIFQLSYVPIMFILYMLRVHVILSTIIMLLLLGNMVNQSYE